jgi:glycerol uptake facilitator-like aquaporin
MSEEIRNEQANRVRESLGDTGPIITPQQDQARSKLSEQYVKPVVAELIGTFGFVFIGAGSIISNTLSHGLVGLVGIAFALGVGLAIMITVFAPTSGGHINPAVTIGFLVTRRIAPLLGLLYIVAQLVGATLAGLLLRAIYPEAIWRSAQLGTTNLGPGISFSR